MLKNDCHILKKKKRLDTFSLFGAGIKWFWREEEGSRNNHWAVAVDQVAALRAAVGYCYSHLELLCAL